MPIKEIVTFSFGVLAALLIVHGPKNFWPAVHKFEYQILKEATRTDNWGNPSIFHGSGGNH